MNWYTVVVHWLTWATGLPVHIRVGVNVSGKNLFAPNWDHYGWSALGFGPYLVHLIPLFLFYAIFGHRPGLEPRQGYPFSVLVQSSRQGWILWRWRCFFMFIFLLCSFLSSCKPNLSLQDLDGLRKKAAQIEVLNELLSDHVQRHFFRKIPSLIDTKLKRNEKKKRMQKRKSQSRESNPALCIHSQLC